jgi:hypothetical protein
MVIARVAYRHRPADQCRQGPLQNLTYGHVPRRGALHAASHQHEQIARLNRSRQGQATSPACLNTPDPTSTRISSILGLTAEGAILLCM